MCNQQLFIAFAIFFFALLSLGCDPGVHQAQLEAEAQALRAKQNSEAIAKQSELLEQSSNQIDVLKDQLAKAERRAHMAEDRVNELEKQIEDANQISKKIDLGIASAKSSANANREFAGPLQAKFFAWNVESEGSDPAVISKQLSEFGSYDIYALTEVLPESFQQFREAVGDNYDSIETKTGRSDRMQIIFDKTRFDLLRRLELDQINYQLRYRSPLVAHFRDRESGIQFMVMVNHLARGKAEVRTRQAEQLVEWARNQNLPIIALGDYNYDFVFADRQGNEGFQKMMRDNIWMWVEPEELIDSNWYDNPEAPDGKDDYPGSLLDFAFVAGSAKTWDTTCRILTRPNDFPDDATTSDHRPYELFINSN